MLFRSVAGAALFLDFVVSMSNFDMGTPEPEQTFINVVIGLSVIAGAMAGAAASRRIHEPS